LIVATAVLVTGCGPNEPGDPGDLARATVEPVPAGGDVDLYCSPSLKDSPIENCSVSLWVVDGTPAVDAEAWLYRAAATLHPSSGAAAFAHAGKRFRWVYLDVRIGSPDNLIGFFGWTCPTDKARGLDTVDHDPGGSASFASVAAGEAAGCAYVKVPA
jgi:hypothetical protein